MNGDAGSWDVIVIGSGAGGLTAALTLARAARSVLVLERADRAGGLSGSFEHDGHRFSPGLHYLGELGEGGDLRNLYEGLGIGADIEFCELNPEGYDHLLVGGDRFDVPAGRDRHLARLIERFPHERSGLVRHFEIEDAILAGLRGVDARFGALAMLRALERAPVLARWGFSTLADLLRTTIRDPALSAILAARCGNHGLPPTRVSLPAHVRMIGHYDQGAYYPRGGGKAVTDAMVRAIEGSGGAVRLGAAVSRIVLTDGAATGVELASGERVRARAVISNASPHATFARMLPRRASREGRFRLPRMESSISAVGVFGAFEGDPRALGLDSGNSWWFRSTDVSGIYGRMARELPIGGADAVFLAVTSLKDPAPGTRSHTFEAFTFVPWEPFARWAEQAPGTRGPDYARLKKHLGDVVLGACNEVVPGFSEAVSSFSIATPLTFDDVSGTYHGAIFGTAKTRLQVGPFAYPIRTSVPGLYLVGASTLGQGIATTAASGLLAAAAVVGASAPGSLLRPPDGSLRIHPSEHPERWLIGRAQGAVSRDVPEAH